MSEELKPCPFCGSTAPFFMTERELAAGRGFSWECILCGACGPVGNTHEKAMEGWSRRATE